MKKIDTTWLKKATEQSIITYNFLIASVMIAIIAIITFNGIGEKNNIFMQLATYALLVLLITVVILNIIARFSIKFKHFVFRDHYRKEQERLINGESLKREITESFERFINSLIEKDIYQRPANSKELKECQVEYMEVFKKEISMIRNRYQKLLKHENVDSIYVIQKLSDLDDLDLENLEHLFTSLMMIKTEDDTWNWGGKDLYKKRITPAYYEAYKNHLDQKLKWPNSIIDSAKENLENMERFASIEKIYLT